MAFLDSRTDEDSVAGPMKEVGKTYQPENGHSNRYSPDPTNQRDSPDPEPSSFTCALFDAKAPDSFTSPAFSHGRTTTADDPAGILTL